MRYIAFLKLFVVMKIVCFHLFNDYSGSPKVLNMVLHGLSDKNYQIDLITSQKGGVLDELLKNNNIRIFRYHYKYSVSLVKTTFRYLFSQLYTFLFSFRYLFKKDVVFFVNTLLPLGPALAGWLMRKKIIYYYHENAFTKGYFYRILAFMMQHFADKIICVSNFQSSFLHRKEGILVVPNALSVEFYQKCNEISLHEKDYKTILMLSSLKRYKGVLEFVQLAQCLSQYRFLLVINDTKANIDSFFAHYKVPYLSNLEIWDRQSEVLPFYDRSSLVLNLSDKYAFIETFGLTILEAISAGIPVIVLTVGGVSELVEDGVNGYRVDIQDFNKIKNMIVHILSNPVLYHSLSQNAKMVSLKYDYFSMINRIESALQ